MCRSDQSIWSTWSGIRYTTKKANYVREICFTYLEKKISWESGLTYFETYFSISNLPKWSRASTKGTYASFGEKKKKFVRCKHRLNSPKCCCVWIKNPRQVFVPPSDFQNSNTLSFFGKSTSTSHNVGRSKINAQTTINRGVRRIHW